MTEPRTQASTRVAVLTVVVLLVQAGVLLGLIGPVTGGFLPQMHVGPYTSGEFFTFVVALDQHPGRFGLYESLLQWIDPVFFLLFSLWLFLAMRPRLLAVVVILIYLGLEVTEQALLLDYVDQLRSAIQVAGPEVIENGMQDPKVLTLSTVTSVKLAVAVLAAAFTFAQLFVAKRKASA